MPARFLVSLCLAAWLWSATALADLIIGPPRGVWVKPSRAGDPRALFGPSSPEADWHITQWNSPKPDLGPFRDGEARGTNQTVRVIGDEIEITAHGGGLACRKEFDTFIGAINPERSQGDRFPVAVRRSPPLSEMKALVHRVNVRPEVARIVDGGCPRTQAVLMTSVVFKNSRSGDTFFYQLRLHKVGANLPAFWWKKGVRGPHAKREGRSLNFGFGDNLSSYGVADAALGQRTSIQVDLLPRIKELLHSGEVPIDRDLANWTVSNAYHGNAIWGNVEVKSAWSGYKLEYH